MRVFGVIALIGSVACSRSSSPPSIATRAPRDAHTASCERATSAKQTAVLFLRSQRWAADYRAETADAQDDGRAWLIHFRKVRDEVPDEAWVSIKKETCVASWIPLK
jgi:hypothetical protein